MEWKKMILAKSARVLALTAAMTLSMLTVPAGAQEVSEEHLKAAREAVAAIKATDEFDTILPQAAQGLKVELIQQSPNLVDLINATVDEKALELAKRRADLEQEAALAYARIFSQEDLENITAFYTSPTGQKLLSDGPIVTRQVYQAADIWRRGIIRDLANSVTETLEAAVGTQAPAVESDTIEKLGEDATAGSQ